MLMKPQDPVVAEKFNTFWLAECKEIMIELLMVCTVSVETMKIVKEMP